MVVGIPVDAPLRFPSVMMKSIVIPAMMIARMMIPRVAVFRIMCFSPFYCCFVFSFCVLVLSCLKYWYLYVREPFLLKMGTFL